MYNYNNTSVPIGDNCILFCVDFYFVPWMFGRKYVFLIRHNDIGINLSNGYRYVLRAFVCGEYQHLLQVVPWRRFYKR